MKTFSRAAYQEASALWDAGAFGPEWSPFRTAAAERGFIYPPEGSSWDQVEEESPSQRAVLHRAIEDTPDALMAAIQDSRTWHGVVGWLLAWSEVRATQAETFEREWNAWRAEHLVGGIHTDVLIRIADR